MSEQGNTAKEVRLSEVTEFIQYGYTAQSSLSRAGPQYLRITDIQNDQVDWAQVPHVNIERDQQSRYTLQPGDIVFARTGATVGKSFLIRSNPPNSAVFASYLIRVRCKQDLLTPEYAAFFFKSEEYWRQIREGAAGTGQPNFNGTKLGNLSVPLWPLQKQRWLVEQLDSLSARSKKAREELGRIPRLVERYKQATLDAALRGELTADWRTAHPTSRSKPLIREATRIARKREGGSTTAGTTKVVTLPLTWMVAPTASIGEVILGRQRSPENHRGRNMRPYVRAANITWDGWDLSDVKEMNFDDRDFNRFRLRLGDVLINEGSGSADEVGKPAIWTGEVKNCCFQNTLIAVRPHAATSEYLYFVFLNAALSRAFVDETRGVNIHHIGRTGLAQFVVPLPPREEQKEIVRRIKTSFSRIDRLSKEASRATELLDRLDQATLAKAFRGELLSASDRDTTLAKPNGGSHR
jgi:type I restriction enzyme S subunit